MHATQPLLRRYGFPEIRRGRLECLQVNLGYRCNQSCLHCHVNAGPARTEMMSRDTIADVLGFLEVSGLRKLDITGGAPELHPSFCELVSRARALGAEITDRCNLTVLLEPGQEGLAAFLAGRQVQVIASLPCYAADNVDRQRGKGVFDKSISALRMLNALGYGRQGSGLELHIVYNPQGPSLPPPQKALEAEYKQVLGESHGIVFNRLLTLTNMPIQRFGSTLVSKGQFNSYLALLRASYREENLDAVMCRSLVSVDWQGYLYDCDFNQMLGLPLLVDGRPRVHLAELSAAIWQAIPSRSGTIATAARPARDRAAAAPWPPESPGHNMLVTAALFLAALLVAYANGANDNFKGVATLFGSDAATYRGAIALATVATFAGSVCSVYFAAGLVKAFSGSGLVPAAIAASPQFLLAIAVAAGLSVLLATLLGLPVSTTHALTGALTGTGLTAVGVQFNFMHLGSVFFIPLLLGPFLAVLLTIPFYRTLRALAIRLGVRRESCICVGASQFIPIRALQYNAAIQQFTLPAAPTVGIAAGTLQDCSERYQGRLLGASAQGMVNTLHYLSAGMVSFARGLNDTPKMVGLLLLVQALNAEFGVLAIATAMAAGGLLNARKVALTLSKRISRMNDGQALTANLVTGLLVVLASRYGLPVSTTHVSVGAIGGIGLVNGSADKRVMGVILASWLLTLPVAAIIGIVVYAVLESF